MKNPLSKLTPRGRRIYYSILTVIVLAIGLVNCLSIMVFNATGNDQCAWRPIPNTKGLFLITDVLPGGVTEKAGIKNNDTLLAINGISVSDSNPQVIINQVPSGNYAKYVVGRQTGRVETQVQILKVFNIVYLATFLLGLGFLFVGYVVVMTKPQGKVQRMFVHYSIAAMLVFAVAVPDIPPGSSQFRQFILGGAFVIGRIIAPALFIRFFYLFPVLRGGYSNSWLKWSLYAIGIVLVACTLLIKNVTTILLGIPFFSVFGFYVTGLMIFTVNYFKYVDKAKRKQLRPILVSALVGIFAFAYILILGATNQFLIFLNPIVFVPAIFIVNLPIAFGYSIFRYRLMDIDLIVKRSLIYGIVTTSLAVIYLLIVSGIGNSISYFFGTHENKLVTVIAFIVIAIAFDPIKRRTQEIIDRSFYAERYNYQKALLEFSQELPQLMNLTEILNSLVNRISSTMHVDKISIALCDEKEGCSAVSKNIPDEYSHFVQEEHGLFSYLNETKQPLSLALLDEEPGSIPLSDSDRDKILKSGIILSVPMFLKGRLIGTINVGPKMSGKIYSQEDIDLLSTVASQAAISIENSRLHLSELEKQKMEEELEIARRIQQSLLPKQSPVMDHMDIAGLSLPALSVGGDYFDYIQLGPKKLLVVVADVSGKGMSAALYMSKIQGMIQLASHMYDSPRDMLIHVNRRLYDGIERKSFITMVLALFDLDKKTVQVCRAGHNKAILGTDGNFEYLSSSGIGLGLERGPIFEQSLEIAERPLVPNSLFFFYSDGLSEAMNEKREMFGEEEICNYVKAHRGSSALELQQGLMRSIKQFQGAAEQHDDITWVLVKYS